MSTGASTKNEASFNVVEHHVYRTGNCDAIELTTLSQHNQHQLEGNPDTGLEPLGKYGARGSSIQVFQSS